MGILTSQLLPTLLDQVSLNLLKVYPALALVTGGLAYYTLGGAVRTSGLGVSNTTWNVLSTILGITTGYLAWGESISTRQLAGVLLGSLSLYLLN